MLNIIQNGVMWIMLNKRIIQTLDVSEGVINSFKCKYYLTESSFSDENDGAKTIYGISIEKIIYLNDAEKIIEESSVIGVSDSEAIALNTLDKLINGSVTPYTLTEILDELAC